MCLLELNIPIDCLENVTVGIQCEYENFEPNWDSGIIYSSVEHTVKK